MSLFIASFAYYGGVRKIVGNSGGGWGVVGLGLGLGLGFVRYTMLKQKFSVVQCLICSVFPLFL